MFSREGKFSGNAPRYAEEMMIFEVTCQLIHCNVNSPET